jgi:hypothetical protein
METVNAPCSRCLGEMRQNVLHSVTRELDEDGMCAEVYKLLQCAGCGTVSMANQVACGFRSIRPPIPIRSRPRFRFQIAPDSDFKSPGGSGPSGTLTFWHW